MQQPKPKETSYEPSSDIESNVENEKESVNIQHDRYHVEWSKDFIGNISIDRRGTHDKSAAKIKGCTSENACHLTKRALFQIFYQQNT